MKVKNLQIKQVAIKELKFADYNPRIWNEKAIADLTASIKKFGVCDPILVNSAPNRKNFILGGHMRIKILRDLKYKTVPVIYLNIPDLKIEKELNLRLNKNTGAFNLELLKNFDIDQLLDIGFDDKDLSLIWDENLEIEEDNFDTIEELKKIKKTDIKPGNLFKMGEHFLMCGDSTKPSDVDKLLGNNKVNTVYTDPIFNIGLDYNSGFSAKNKYGGKVDDNKTEEEYKLFLKQSMQNALKHCEPDCNFFYYSDQKNIWLVQTLYKELGIKNQRVCLWVKNSLSPTPQCAFNKSYEACVFGTIGKPFISNQHKNLTEILNKEIEPGNRTIDDICDIIDIWLAKRIAGQNYCHAAEKPLSLHEKPLKRCTKPGQIVLDLFAGSGSTMLSCEQLKRKAYLMEIDETFCQLILNRFKQFTGKNYEKIN